LFIINEVYNELTYEFQINSPVILVDIGMNIGISTMFFLQKQNIIKIIGYEPVQKTYQKLIKNLELNNFRDKVTALNFGLGKNDRIEIFEFSNEYKASVGLIGLNEYKQKSSKVVEKVQVEIKDAFTQISNILEQNIDVDIFIKMDCEGGEYEILPRLYETNLLKRIKYLVMEWHGIEFLDQKNIFNGFSIFYHKISPDTGMLYAVRNN
jgi:FkbM family methyltransferase